MSMSKEEQADLLKRLCKEQKRGDWAKKKTMVEQAIDLGIMTTEDEEEQELKAILEEAEARGESLSPVRYKQATGDLDFEVEEEPLPPYWQAKASGANPSFNLVMRKRSRAQEEEEELFGPKALRKSTERLCKKLVNLAKGKSPWIKVEDLPLCFRFAMKRLVMSETSFHNALTILGLQLDSVKGEMPESHSYAFGTEREFLTGIDDDSYSHATQKRRASLGRLGSPMPVGKSAPDEASKDSEEDGAEQFKKMRQRLLALYELIREGRIDLEEAPQRYREILSYDDVDDETLIATLENYAIRTEQIPFKGRPALRGSPVQSTRSDQHTTFSGSLKQEMLTDKDIQQIVEELGSAIKLYRIHGLPLADVIKLVREYLAPYTLRQSVIEEFLTDNSLEPDEAAMDMWDLACDDSPPSSPSPILATGENESPYSQKPPHEEYRNTNTELPGTASKRVKDTVELDATQSSPTGKHLDAHGTIAKSYNCDESVVKEKRSGSQDLDPTNDNPQISHSPKEGLLPISRETKPPIRKDVSRGQCENTATQEDTLPAATDSAIESPLSGTPTSNSRKSAGESSPYDPHVFTKTSWDGVVHRRYERSSPEDGMTDDLYGLNMSTKKARELGHALGLSFDYLKDSVRTGSVQRKERKAKIARASADLPRSKRKASGILDSVDIRKSPKLSDHFEVFAKPLETREDFVSSHLEPHARADATNLCSACLHQPCQCELGLQSPPVSERGCTKCQQLSCTCMQGIQSLSGDHTGDTDMNSPDPTQPDLANIRKYSNSPHTVLAYLSGVAGAQDLFDSHIKLDDGNPTEAMTECAYKVLVEVGKGIESGNIKGPITEKDKVAVAILQRIQGSSHEVQKQDQSIDRSSKSASNVGSPRRSSNNDKSPSKSHREPNPIIAYLSGKMKDSNILHRLGKLNQATRLSSSELGWLITLQDHVEQGKRLGAIEDPQSEIDISAMSCMKGLIQMHSSHKIKEKKENILPHGIDNKSRPLQDPGPNPMLAYLKRVLEDQDSEESTLELIRGLGQSPMSNAKMRNVSLVYEHIQQGLQTGEIDGEGPRGKKDWEAFNILIRDLKACHPLHAWPRANGTASKTAWAENLFTGSARLRASRDLSNTRSPGLSYGPSQGDKSPRSFSPGVPIVSLRESFTFKPEAESQEKASKAWPTPEIRRSIAYNSLQPLIIPESPYAPIQDQRNTQSSPAPPPTPRPKARELQGRTSPNAEPGSNGSNGDHMAGSPSDLELGTSRVRGEATFHESFDLIYDIALKKQIPVSSVLAKRRTIRKKPDEANYHFWINSFFQNSNGAPNAAAALNKLFDKYRDNAKEEPDKIGVEGSMKYLGDLSVKLDEVVVLAVLTELNAPTMGEFTRNGFLDGWTKNRSETLSKQQAQVVSWRRSLTTSPDFFKKVYKQTFILARQPGQRVLPLDAAIEYWRLLFTSPSLSWNTASSPWLTWWIEYLEEKWAKSINKDMWDQTYNFMIKSLEDETMSWWSEDGAWPGVLDEFVGYVKQKRGTGTGTEMDIG